MLRTRKKDVRLKPNRKLDKRSSRTMLFENEELRLRTMEINAEVERGQSSIKKLRRENDHLRREMWALREEYERLETLLKNLDLAGCSANGGRSKTPDDTPDYANGAQHPYVTVNHQGTDASSRASECCHANNCHLAPNGSPPLYVEPAEWCNVEIDNIENYQKAYGRMPRRCSSAGTPTPRSCLSLKANTGPTIKGDNLNINEEDEDGYTACSLLLPDHPETTQLERNSQMPLMFSQGLGALLPREAGAMSSRHDKQPLPQITNLIGPLPECEEKKGEYLIAGDPAVRQGVVNNSDTQSDSLGLVETRPKHQGEDAEFESADDCKLKRWSSVVIRQKDVSDPTRLRTVHPLTIAFDLEDHPSVGDVSVQDIIDQLEHQLNSQLTSVRAVRVVGSLVYVNLDHQSSLLRLIDKELAILGAHVHLVSACQDLAVIAVGGVPHYISDKTIAMLLSAFGMILGQVEQRFYKGIDTGERLARIKLKEDLGLPRFLTIRGCRIPFQVLGSPNRTPADETRKNLQEKEPADDTESLNQPKIAKSFKYRSQLSIELHKKSNSNTPEPRRKELDEPSISQNKPLETKESPVTPRVNFGDLPSAQTDLPQPENTTPSTTERSTAKGILRKNFFGQNIKDKHRVSRTDFSSRGNRTPERDRKSSVFSIRRRKQGIVHLDDSCDDSPAASLETSVAGIHRASRRDSENSSRNREELPWCGCWGNGCL